jgi:16S rRNA (uracil1498-N3)-methyltransferase
MVLPLQLEQRILKHMRADRLAAGHRFTLADGQGSAWLLELVSSTQPTAKVLATEYQAAPVVPALTLVQAIVANKRMDLIVRQATELGIRCIIPLITLRSEPRLDARQAIARQQRWQRLAVAAAEQCRTLWLPQVECPCSLADALALTAASAPKVCAWEQCPGGLACADLKVPDPAMGAALFIGPVGGFDLEEVNTMEAAGCQLLSLGSQILRVETAALVASSLLLSRLGGLDNSPAQKPCEKSHRQAFSNVDPGGLDKLPAQKIAPRTCNAMR